MSETIYVLKHPIIKRSRVAGMPDREEEITEVSVRRVKAKDLRLLDKHPGQIAQSIALIGALTGLPAPTVDELDGEDVQGLGDIIADFFPTPPGNGEGS